LKKALKKLHDMGFIKYHTNNATDERIYCMEKKLSSHDVYLLDVYANLVQNGAKILEFKKEPVYECQGKKIRPDAFIKYEISDYTFGAFIEIDFTHATDIKKYEPFYNEEYFSKLYGGDPLLLVVGDNPKKYTGDLDVSYMDYGMFDFTKFLIF
jgi:hypothetical protein